MHISFFFCNFVANLEKCSYMAHLHLENIGPISIVDIDLRRYNVFIGPQSSGKSTIAKMISLCSWMEKRAMTTLSEDVFLDNQEFIDHVSEYHKMHGYFNKLSVVEYVSEFVQISYKAEALSVKILDKLSYKRKKILYIPSDRNLVAMPELERMVVGTNTNLRSFTYDWFDARKSYDKGHRLSILDLNMEYYYDKDEKVNKDKIIHTNGKTYDITLSDASSGLQSITPLTLLLNYFSNQYFSDYGKTTSYEKDEEKKELEEKIALLYPFEKRASRLSLDTTSHSFAEIAGKAAESTNELSVMASRRSLFSKLTTPNATNFIIEEPEQNLFPSTQAQLISSLLNICNAQEKQHSFTLTTHSPYILTQLNILLFAGLLQKQGKAEVVSEYVSDAIAPEDLNVYAVQDDGTVISIIDSETNMISQNYLDSVSEELSIKFQQLYRLLF